MEGWGVNGELWKLTELGNLGLGLDGYIRGSLGTLGQQALDATMLKRMAKKR